VGHLIGYLQQHVFRRGLHYDSAA